MTVSYLEFAELNDRLVMLAQANALEPVRFLVTGDGQEVGTEVFWQGQTYLLIPDSVLEESRQELAIQMLDLLIKFNQRTELDISVLLQEL